MADTREMAQDTTPAYLRGGSALKKKPPRKRQAWPLEVFFGAVCAFFLVFIIANEIPLSPIFILIVLLALFAGAYLELKTGHRFAVFAYPAIVLAFRFKYYALFGVFYCEYWNIVALVFAIGIYYALRIISRNRLGSAAALVIFIAAVPSGIAVNQMSYDREGKCEEETDDVLKMGGTLWDAQQPFALACDIDGKSVFISAPKDKVISKILDRRPPEALTLESRDSAYVLDFEPETRRLVALLDGRREIAYYSAYPMEFLRGISTDSVHCSHPVATAWDRTRENTLILCREKGSIIFCDLASRNDAWRIDGMAAMPSGMAVSTHMEKAYITDLFGTTVKVLDLDARYPVTPIKTGFSTAGIAVSPNGKTIYIGRPLSGRIDVFDAETLTRTRFRGLLRGVSMLATDPGGRYVFAASQVKGTVAVWDLSSEVTYGPYKIGRPINDIAYCRTSNRLYVSTPCALRYINILMLK